MQMKTDVNRYSWYALGLLTLVYVFNYLDRTIIYILLPLIKKDMIAAGLAGWSIFSGLTGFASGFWSLLICRMMVGVGEATLGPAALSLLSDYFPPRVRATVQAIYSSGIAIGAGLAFFLGGWLGQYYGWRVAFYALGFPGIVIAVLVYFMREQPRGTTEAGATKY